MKPEDLDILTKPIMQKPTKKGFFLTILSIGSFSAFATYTFYGAANTMMSTTIVDFTTAVAINNTISLHFQCPENTTVNGIQGILGSYNEYSQTFTHCLVYSSTCPSIGLSFIPAGAIRKIDVCIQSNSFQTMLAMGDKVPCSFASSKTASILPFWKIPENNPMSIIELNNTMTYGGDTYLLNQVRTESGKKTVIQSTNTGAPDLLPDAKKMSIDIILAAICSNAGAISAPLANQYLGLKSIFSGSSLADNYNFFSINYKQTILSQLQANPLGVLGSVSGAWGGIIAVFGIIYTILLSFSDPNPSQSNEQASEYAQEEKININVKHSAVLNDFSPTKDVIKKSDSRKN